MKDVVQEARLVDHGVIIEYQLPMTSKRLDFMICGKDAHRKDNAVIVELKQWDKCEETESDSCVLTIVGKGLREVLHPSVQVQQYALYLKDTHTAFYKREFTYLFDSVFLSSQLLSYSTRPSLFKKI